MNIPAIKRYYSCSKEFNDTYNNMLKQWWHKWWKDISFEQNEFYFLSDINFATIRRNDEEIEECAVCIFVLGANKLKYFPWAYFKRNHTTGDILSREINRFDVFFTVLNESSL